MGARVEEPHPLGITKCCVLETKPKQQEFAPMGVRVVKGGPPRDVQTALDRLARRRGFTLHHQLARRGGAIGGRRLLNVL